MQNAKCISHFVACIPNTFPIVVSLFFVHLPTFVWCVSHSRDSSVFAYSHMVFGFGSFYVLGNPLSLRDACALCIEYCVSRHLHSSHPQKFQIFAHSKQRRAFLTLAENSACWRNVCLILFLLHNFSSYICIMWVQEFGSNVCFRRSSFVVHLYMQIEIRQAFVCDVMWCDVMVRWGLHICVQKRDKMKSE